MLMARVIRMVPLARASVCAAAAIAALCISATASAGLGSTAASMGSTAWSNLWWTRDQQGQRLLQSDQPGKAAARFSDPRRRAYADLRAGQYAQAAKLLAPFHDVHSEYNRGNALAHTGHLQDALDAYDAALAKAPNDHDARHNRDLVARALRQSGKQHRSQQHGQEQQKGQHGGASPHAGGAQQHQGGNGQHTGDAQHNPGGSHNGSQQQRSGNGQQNSGNGQHGPQQHSGGTGPHSGGAQQNSGNPQQGGGAGQQAGGSPQQHSGASLSSGTVGQNGNRQQPSQAAAAAAAAARANTGRAASAAASKPESEQALSLEQWLRRIPDDPGGLLRRKFLIEHLMRQRSADQRSANP